MGHSYRLFPHTTSLDGYSLFGGVGPVEGIQCLRWADQPRSLSLSVRVCATCWQDRTGIGDVDTLQIALSPGGSTRVTYIYASRSSR